MNMIDKAIQFAAIKHEGQYRKRTDIPYITHPFVVGMILQQAGYKEEIIAAGILHDALEDTDTTEEELLSEFGQSVVDLVKAASEEDKSLSWEERKQRSIDALALKSPDQIAVIVADKLHNIRSIQSDIDSIGGSVWTRFNRGKREQSCYYMSIINAVTPFKKEVPLIRKLATEVNQLFIGIDKLPLNKIDAMFDAAYGFYGETVSKLDDLGLLNFIRELRVDADELTKNRIID
ncbi:HD domain-containing protein [Lederbergia citrea]|uniref:HD domain-containing protein n=1 Tax=Lederbergia citrea TaxID=2833581 RepID=A0A942USD4_9BACI|nr:HD domain-containing protein [Lederbergia citrea]MBS4224201.1 HD domain-containing protein [Lederbergia citrea]